MTRMQLDSLKQNISAALRHLFELIEVVEDELNQKNKYHTDGKIINFLDIVKGGGEKC